MKDNRIKSLSLKEFYEYIEFCDGITDGINLWNGEKPEPCTIYFQFLNDKIVCIEFGFKSMNFGETIDFKLENIYVSYRDGKTEYTLLDDKIYELEVEKEKIKKRKSKHQDKRLLKVENHINRLEKLKNFFPLYKEPKKIIQKKKLFNDYIVNLDCEKSELAKNYVVLDVETNGTISSSDDLLSLSIYDPFSGKAYNRFLPLDLQPLVLTTYINGIVEKDLECETHITQGEFDEIINEFNLKEKTILAYSGGKSLFDARFLQNYCKRHKITGFDNFNFLNIKDFLPKGTFETNGKITKDNMCKLFGINGITEIHTGINDCVLEWKLFEKIYNKNIFFIKNSLYEYNNDYIIPISYLLKNVHLREMSGIEMPTIIGKPELIYEYHFPQQEILKIKKFPTNITGVSIEHLINVLLNAERQNNLDFLLENKRKIRCIGTLDSNFVTLPISLEDDGLLKNIDINDKKKIDEINNVTLIIKENILPLIDFIKHNIFSNEDKIFSQELVISDDKKILALCDLSSKKRILEIKTFDIIDDNKNVKNSITQQLYYQYKGREIFVLSIVFNSPEVVENLTFSIYKIHIQETDIKLDFVERPLWQEAKDILQLIINNPRITYEKLANLLNKEIIQISRTIKALKNLKYIERIGANKNGYWKVLKNVNETFLIPKYF